MKICFTLLVTIFCNVQLTAGTFITGNTQTYFPPCNLEGEDIGLAANLVWEAPGTCEPDSLPFETAGFRIYRDEIMIAEVNGETFEFEDIGDGTYLQPGTYNYYITALYEVGNDLVESEPEGPVEVVIAPGFGFVSFIGFVFECFSNEPVAGASVLIDGCHTTSNENGVFTCTVFSFDTLTAHVSAPGYCDTTFLITWNGSFPIFSFCLMPCDISGSIVAENKPHEMNVFPVPASDFLNVQMDAGIRQIRLINFSGEIVSETRMLGEQSFQLDVNRFPANIYTLQVITINGQIWNKKVVINR